MLDEIKAQELIAQGEGQQVELKREVPSKVRELSEEVCALANATGGYILLGVSIVTSTRLTSLATRFG